MSYRVWIQSWLLVALALCLLVQGVLILTTGQYIWFEPIAWVFWPEMTLLVLILALGIWNIVDMIRRYGPAPATMVDVDQVLADIQGKVIPESEAGRLIEGIADRIERTSGI